MKRYSLDKEVNVPWVVIGALLLLIVTLGCTFYFAPEFVIWIQGGGNLVGDRYDTQIMKTKDRGVFFLLLGYVVIFGLSFAMLVKRDYDAHIARHCR